MRSEHTFLNRGRYLLLFGFLAVFMGNFGQSFYLGSYGGAIQQSLGLSASGYGLIYSIATLMAGTLLMVVGGYIDRLPLLRFTLLVAAGLFLASLVFLFADNVAVLLLAFFLVRLCGQGLFPHTGITTMARCFDSNRGKAISIAASGVPAGEIVLPLLAAWLISAVGWQRSWLLVTLLIPLVFVPLAIWLLGRASADGYDLTPAEHTRSGQDVSGRREVLRDTNFWRVVPATLTAPFVVTGVFIHQAYFMSEKGWSPQLFAISFVAYGIVHWLSSLVSGALVDRLTAVRLLPYYNLPIVLAMLLVALAEGPVVPVMTLALLGVAIGFGGPVNGALWAEVYGTAKLGSIRSMTVSFTVWATSVSPILFGVLIDQGVRVETLTACLAFAVLLASLSAAFSYRSPQG